MAPPPNKGPSQEPTSPLKKALGKKSSLGQIPELSSTVFVKPSSPAKSAAPRKASSVEKALSPEKPWAVSEKNSSSKILVPTGDPLGNRAPSPSKAPLTTEKSTPVKRSKSVADVRGESEPTPNIAGLREQILANANILYPLVHEAEWEDQDFEVPDFHVVVRGRLREFNAAVVYRLVPDKVEDTRPHVVVWFDSADEMSAGKALENLLALTSHVLRRRWVSLILPLHDEHEEIKYKGGTYVKET